MIENLRTIWTCRQARPRSWTTTFNNHFGTYLKWYEKAKDFIGVKKNFFHFIFHFFSNYLAVLTCFKVTHNSYCTAPSINREIIFTYAAQLCCNRLEKVKYNGLYWAQSRNGPGRTGWWLISNLTYTVVTYLVISVL